MSPYRTLETTYRHLAARPARWAADAGLDGNLDAVVAAVRDHGTDPERSDAFLRTLLSIGREQRDAVTVALHALAPALRRRIARIATAEYHSDALCELAFVLLDSDLDGPHLAHRLVNRAHSRVWRHARRAHTHGTRNVTTTVPCPPDRLGVFVDRDAAHTDVAERVATQVDLERFLSAVDADVAAGVIPADTWQLYRELRLQRAVTGVAARSTGSERVALHRAGRRLAPHIDRYLAAHVA